MLSTRRKTGKQRTKIIEINLIWIGFNQEKEKNKTFLEEEEVEVEEEDPAVAEDAVAGEKLPSLTTKIRYRR